MSGMLKRKLRKDKRLILTDVEESREFNKDIHLNPESSQLDETTKETQIMEICFVPLYIAWHVLAARV